VISSLQASLAQEQKAQAALHSKVQSQEGSLCQLETKAQELSRLLESAQLGFQNAKQKHLEDSQEKTQRIRALGHELDQKR